MRLIKAITGAVRTIIRRNKMKSNRVPAMAGLNSHNQLTFNGTPIDKDGVALQSAPTQSKPSRNREHNPYTICNIGKRIWNGGSW